MYAFSGYYPTHTRELIMGQKIIVASNGYPELDVYLDENRIKKVFLVCGRAFFLMTISNYFKNLEMRKGIKVVYFNDFKANPSYDSIVEGVESFRRSKCDFIIAVGGGSAIDIAKCIKIYARADLRQPYLEQSLIPNEIKLLVIPTTAGSGSEATHYAVVYYNGEKQSISDSSCLPSAVVMDPSGLVTLPDYQRKVTMMDAFCHAIESFWSINSNEESRRYSSKAIQLILDNMDLYLSNDMTGNEKMLWAANFSGRAINITQTTAGHAMCYKLTTLCGIAHGHAAALCVARLWPYMIVHIDKCIDFRGKEYLKNMFDEIAGVMGCEDAMSAAVMFQDILKKMNLKYGEINGSVSIDVLRNSVNSIRLKNNPVILDNDTLRDLYFDILGEYSKPWSGINVLLHD